MHGHDRLSRFICPDDAAVCRRSFPLITMHLEFLLRSPNGTRTETAIQVAIAYAWQEGPDDLHIQFERGGDNFQPVLNAAGDYVLPNPNGKGEVACYSMAFVSGEMPPDKKYQRRLEKLWPSPNRF